MDNLDTQTPQSTHPDYQNYRYQSYIDQFNIDELEQQILQGCRINGINAYVECVGHHAQSDKANKVALVHEDTQGNIHKITYAQLDKLSGKMANLLTSFWFVGRDDDIITTAGYRVGPTDVENTVMEHPSVAETAAIGVPDDIRGHIIKSYVVLKDGYAANDELAKDIQSLVHARLSAHAYPRIVEFIDALPKTPSGKVQRFMLRSMSEAH